MTNQFSNRHVGPVGDEVGVLQILAQDDMAYGQGDCAVGGGEDRNPFVGEARGIRQADVERHDLHLIVDAAFGHPLRKRVVEVGCFQDVGAEIQYVLGVGKVRRLTLNKDKQAVVTMQIDRGVVIPVDSVASVKSQGIIGDKYIQISLGGDESSYKPGGTIVDTESAVDLESLISKFAFGQVK